MKSLLTSLFVLLGLSMCIAQGNLRYSYTITDNGTTSNIDVFVKNSVSGTENVTSFTMNIYFDNSESVVSSFDTSPVTALGWFAFPSSSNFNGRVNPNITSPHNGFGNINVLDFNGAGTDVGATDIKILTIVMDNTPGTSAPSAFYLSSSAEGHPEQVYNDNASPIPNAYPVIMNQGSTFPVEWLGFEAYAIPGNRSLLRWATATEENNSGFEIERASATDLVPNWEKIGFVEGAGSTPDVSEYELIDPMPYSGENLYRIRQIDFNGDFSYSEIRTVWFDEAFQLSVYPNPTKYQLNLRFLGLSQEGQSASYELLDARGRLVQSGSLDPFRINPVEVSSLPEGGYVMKVKLGQEMIVKRIAKLD